MLDFRFEEWKIHQTEGAEYVPNLARPNVPDVGGDPTIGAFNVLNYFTTMGSRGANNAEEFQRQEDKIVSAILEMGAAVLGLMEIEKTRKSQSTRSSMPSTNERDNTHLVGSCDAERTPAALVDWVDAEDLPRPVITGDLNAYDQEAPITTLKDGGHTDLREHCDGEEAYSYVFDGQLGYFDYAMAGEELMPFVSGAASWHANSDEVPIFDYTTRFKQPAQQAIYESGPYRASDHDPVLLGLSLTELDEDELPEPVDPEPTDPADPDASAEPTLTVEPQHIVVEDFIASDDDEGVVEWRIIGLTPAALGDTAELAPTGANSVMMFLAVAAVLLAVGGATLFMSRRLQ